MTRETGIVGAFPYTSSDGSAPHTDGTLISDPRDSPTANPPMDGELGISGDAPNRKNRGLITKGANGNTDYIHANSIAYNVFAGNS